ncbi:unnamed protein product, partial [Didymodactylos carnosus]
RPDIPASKLRLWTAGITNLNGIRKQSSQQTKTVVPNNSTTSNGSGYQVNQSILSY